MFYKTSSSLLVHEKYQNQRKVVQTLNLLFPRFINNLPGKYRDCHDQEIAD